MRLILQAALRFHLRAPLQFLLSFVGIALGVAVFTGVDVANHSANAAFETSAEFVNGAATHRLLPVDGELDEDIFFDQFAAQGIPAAPLLELPARTAEGGLPLTILGVDPIAEASMGDRSRIGLASLTAFDTLISEPSTALVSASLESFVRGDTLSVSTGETTVALRITGIIDAAAGPAAIVLTDIATAQELSGMIGRLSRIDLIVPEAAAAELADRVPQGTVLVPTASTNDSFRQLSNAFRINILALGLLALAVGTFLVYASAEYSLARRSRTLSILQTLGAGRRRIASAIVWEFLALGMSAATLGVVLGYFLADALVDLMLFTVSDFSFRAAVAAAPMTPIDFFRGIALGVAATLIGIVAPLRSAVQRDTQAGMRSLRVGRRVDGRRAVAVAAGFAVLAAVLLLAPGSSLLVGFAALACMLGAFAAATPPAARLLISTIEFAAQRSIGLRQAARNVRAHLGSISIPTAALTLAVACVIGVGVMISSFRDSLQDWLQTTLTSDIYIGATTGDGVSTALIEQLANDPRSQTVSLSANAVAELPEGPTRLRAFSPGNRGWGIEALSVTGSDWLDKLGAGNGIAITEPWAVMNQIETGANVSIPGRFGARSFPVVAIYRSYDAGGASILMSLAAWQQLSGSARIDGIGIELYDSNDAQRFAEEIRTRSDVNTIRVSTVAAIRDISLEIFDRTFLITEVLRLLAGAVAFLGMLSALMAVQLARRREFGILRSIGFAPVGLQRLIMLETGIVGACAGIISIPCGIVLAAMLIRVINVRSFGWSMDLIVHLSALLPGLGLAVAAALLAGIVPALRAGRGPIADALRDA